MLKKKFFYETWSCEVSTALPIAHLVIKFLSRSTVIYHIPCGALHKFRLIEISWMCKNQLKIISPNFQSLEIFVQILAAAILNLNLYWKLNSSTRFITLLVFLFVWFSFIIGSLVHLDAGCDWQRRCIQWSVLYYKCTIDYSNRDRWL